MLRCIIYPLLRVQSVFWMHHMYIVLFVYFSWYSNIELINQNKHIRRGYWPFFGGKCKSKAREKCYAASYIFFIKGPVNFFECIIYILYCFLHFLINIDLIPQNKHTNRGVLAIFRYLVTHHPVFLQDILLRPFFFALA